MWDWGTEGFVWLRGRLGLVGHVLRASEEDAVGSV
jgi:hypothetical protein